MTKGTQITMPINIPTKEEFDKHDTPTFKFPEDVLYYRVFNNLDEALSGFKVEYGKRYNIKINIELEEK
jgi:hypothetical protein